MSTQFAIPPAIFETLKQPNRAGQQRAAQQLLELVVHAHRDLPPNRFQEFFTGVNFRISGLVVLSGDRDERLGGLAAVEALLNFTGEDAATKLTRMAGYLRAALRFTDNEVLVRAASLLGQVVTPGGALTAELVESEVRIALEQLQVERQETRRFAAVLVIREFAKNSPTLLHAFIPQILESIWTALCDVKLLIREIAAEATGGCLKILSARDTRIKNHWYEVMYQKAQAGLKHNNVENVHGSLLVLKELLMLGGMFMLEHFKETCDTMLLFKSHRDMKIRSEVVAIIPQLAKYSPQEFSSKWISKFMPHLTSQLKKDKEKSDAFLAIGLVAQAITSGISPYLDGILLAIRDGLSHLARNRSKDASIFKCISMLAGAVGQTLSKYIDPLLDPMFACGLSDGLINSLVEMTTKVQPVKLQIQEKLLDLISLVLCGQSFKPVGCPDNARPPVPNFARDWTQNGITHGEAETALALNTLGSFDFGDHVLHEFVRTVALQYIKNPSPTTRRAAAYTCCQIYANDPIVNQSSLHSIGVVGSVISQLLDAAIGDPVAEIRRTILVALDTTFDRFLAEQDNIRKIVMAVNESDFEVRKAAIEILGRLTTVNPAYVLPPLRKLIQNFTMGIHTSKDAHFEEEGARLVSMCVVNASELVKPYVKMLTPLILQKANSTDPSVAASVIAAVGDLSVLGGRDVLPYIPQVMPVIIDAIQDSSAPLKRGASLKALGQLVSNTGYVIQPYTDYPNLLDILTNIIKTDPSAEIRDQTIRVLGVLGALDPYKYQQSLDRKPDLFEGEAHVDSDVDLVMSGNGPDNEDFYPTVVINILLNSILRDSTLSQHHPMVIDAIVSIFKTLGLKCVAFLGQIIPAFFAVIRGGTGRTEAYFNQLSILVQIVREHIRPFNEDITTLALDYLEQPEKIRNAVLLLIEAMSKSLGTEFYGSLVKLFPGLLRLIERDDSSTGAVATRTMHTLLVFGQTAELGMYLILPKLVNIFTNPQKMSATRKGAIDTISGIARQTNVSDHCALLVHSLSDVLKSANKMLGSAAHDCLVTLLFQYSHDMRPFLDGIKLCLTASPLSSEKFDDLYKKIKAGQPLPQNLRPSIQMKSFGEDVNYATVAPPVVQVNQEHLKAAWSVQHKTTKEDWQEWLRRFSLELLRESPNMALRACKDLASIYPQLARDLLNTAYASCWPHLFPQYQEELIAAFETALNHPMIPPEILQAVLKVAEFMEHDDKPLPIDIGRLGIFAGKCHAYAKALHYKEVEYDERPTSSVIEALIAINNQLQQTDAAFGLLKSVAGRENLELKATWFEKLGKWNDALLSYEQKEGEIDPFESTMGRMRCLHALGSWRKLQDLAQQKWGTATLEQRRKIASLAAAGAWGLNQWESMDTYLEVMKINSPDRSFFGAISCLHQNNFVDAMENIEKARDALDTELAALLAESYTRAYGVVVRVQMLAELEEIIIYKRSFNNPEKQATMRETWKKRLLGCEGNVETWQRMLKVRRLVLEPIESVDLWIKFADLCRKSDRRVLAGETLDRLDRAAQELQPESGLIVPIPEVKYAQFKLQWTEEKQQQAAMNGLRQFTVELAESCSTLVEDYDTFARTDPNSILSPISKTAELKIRADRVDRMKTLLSKCYLRLGGWMTSLTGYNWTGDYVEGILKSYKAATDYNPNGYKAWHAWALANFEVINAMAVPHQHQGKQPKFNRADVEQYVVSAIRGFFQAISKSALRSTLQDTLRLLTLWFAHGGNPEVMEALKEGFQKVGLDTWLEVIPQLIARINQPNARVRQAIHALLCDIGKVHPQALMFPLMVAMKSDAKGRSDAAKAVMNDLKIHSAELVEQAQLVSRELIRTAVLWHELWHEGLEEASRLYFGDHDAEAMYNHLTPLHKLLDEGAKTLREISFIQTFGRDLEEARKWCETYRETGEKGDIDQAWDLYYQVFKRIEKQLPQLHQLELKYISPDLKDARNLVVAVPGTYQSGHPIVRIMSFDPVLQVIKSKQRPRKMTLKGSDGRDYSFLLKGHEDIRQDERVMQLFGLVNTLLANDTESFKRHLNITTFPVIPLSQSSGLLSWVPHSDTLHNLIKEYRDARRILINIEHRIMLQMAPDYDNLTLLQKVEVFGYAMDNTTGKDLSRILWLKSRSSEVWFERRTNYTRSLAVMSMVGYILGLGDRHPSNLMLDRVSGKITHIDFGDCFEIAMHREKYPERVPFRLTRMITYAMDVAQIEGTFRTSAEAVMRVLRDNKESLMAVLEAFIHDPLLNWRLTSRESPHETSFPSERRQSLMANLSPDNGVDEGLASKNPRFDIRTSSYMDAARARAAASNGEMLPNTGRPGRDMPHRGSVRDRPAAGGRGSISTANDPEARDQQNARAVQVLARVKTKLNGTDFKPDEEGRDNVDVKEQVTKLVRQATSVENICQHYIGWCSFW